MERSCTASHNSICNTIGRETIILHCVCMCVCVCVCVCVWATSHLFACFKLCVKDSKFLS